MRKWFLSLIVMLVVACSMIACLTLAPPPSLDVPPPKQPRILDESAVPPSTIPIDLPQVLTVTGFSVIIDRDPNEDVSGTVVLDGVPIETQFFTRGVSSSQTSATFKITSFDENACHTIAFVVAQPGQPTIGDQIVWQYWPRDKVCKYYDAGFPDAADMDGADGADE